jgi:hypothetical protein
LTLQKIIKTHIIHKNPVGLSKNPENSIHLSENHQNSRKLCWPFQKSEKLYCSEGSINSIHPPISHENSAGTSKIQESSIDPSENH